MNKKQAQSMKDQLYFLTVREVTERLKINRHTLYELIYAGKLEAIRVGKSYRISVGALDAFVTNNAVD